MLEVGDRLVVIGRPEDLSTFLADRGDLMGSSLVALGGAFLASALLARAGRRIGLPTIPLFMAAGIIFGPNTPGISLVDHPEEIELLAALGLVLLLFHLGLEFSLDDLACGRAERSSIGATYLSLNLGGGLAFGFALGWGTREALVIAGAIGISSSAIVTKLLVELRRLANPETRLILGIVVVEDLFLALYLAVLQPVLSGSSGWHGDRAMCSSPSSSSSSSCVIARRARASSDCSSRAPTTSCSRSASSALRS